jgi:hypothetical protein
MSQENLLTVIKIVCCYQLFLLVFGTLSNLFSFYICTRIKQNMTFIFLSFLSITNIMTLYHWNLESFFPYLFGIDWKNLNLYTCKFFGWFQFTGLQSSAWLLYLMSVEQCLSVKIKHWRSIYFKSKQAYMTAAFVASFFTLYNLHVLFTFGLSVNLNGTEKVFCQENANFSSRKFMSSWSRVHSFTYSIVPFSILIISNSAMISHIYKSGAKMALKKSK